MSQSRRPTRAPLSREAVVAAALEGLPLPPPDPRRWAEQVTEFARAAREALARRPEAARPPVEQVPPGPRATEVSAWLLAVLTAGGLPATAAAHGASLIVEHVGGSAARDAADGAGAVPRPEPLAGLGAPTGPLADATPDERFEFGLDVLVTGLAAMAARRHSSPRL
ncbi:TetR/AcrR family transcriptional regulator C-terminal domain-containing protein [Streptomyces sp. 8L]|uniref:TetR/AcrR family transcriptional regulator C-terminal domain-containing protein n=1 Tax=Streptomyces sp. 8L TaxID=2877242 RepID=UPI001CD4C7EB|nr:TetR/AcrR family transcriptional regulator C-terminal domain-containing protein [Streptomyces sp. 8L]MCA1219331.1 TetR/AcrR family transcriptional regulator C-terminal domain-containing protein [Streptomyces sp. 8L]